MSHLAIVYAYSSSSAYHRNYNY